MSGAATEYVWDIKKKLTPTCKLVLLAFAHRANIKADEPGIHKCWPSADCIAEDTGYSRKTVQRSINELVACGLLHRTPQTRAGMKIESIYRIPNVEQYITAKRSETTAENQMGQSVPTMGQAVPHRWDTVTHKPKTNNQKNIKYPKPQKQRHQYPPEFSSLCAIYPGFTDLRMSKIKAYELWKMMDVQDQQSLGQAIKSYRLDLHGKSWQSPKHLENFIKQDYWKKYTNPVKTVTNRNKAAKTITKRDGSNGGVCHVCETQSFTEKKILTKDQAVELLINSQSPVVEQSVRRNWHMHLIDYVMKNGMLPTADDIKILMINAGKVTEALDSENELTSPIFKKHNATVRKRRKVLGNALLPNG